MVNSGKKDVFISYATKDGKQFADALHEALTAERITVWQDVIALQEHVGEDWWKLITDGIDGVNYVVMIVTQEAFKRDIVVKEWRYALRNGICVLPIHADPDLDLQTVPRWMNRNQFAFLGYTADANAICAVEGWRAFVGKIKSPCKTLRYPFMVDDLGVYIKRDQPFNELSGLLLDADRKNPRAITNPIALRGTGGYGKTTLARAICHDPQIQDAFSDGILWVTLGESADADTVRTKLNGLIEELSGDRVDYDVERAKSELKDLLANRDILLVIDDVWKSELLPPFLQGGTKTARLITTRNEDVLPAHVHRVTITAMESNESVALLGYGVGSEHVRTHVSELRALAERLGEYPLLLGIANGTLTTRIRSREPIARALDYLKRSLDQRGVTKALRIENSDDRHRAVDACLQLSIEHLTLRQLEWFKQLAIFPSDTAIPFSTLEKAWACDELDVEDGCAALNNLSLLQDYDLASRTIQLHNIIRAYLREQVIGGVELLRLANIDFLSRFRIAHWRDLSAYEPYLWDNLGYHLLEADQRDELIATVLDLRYLAIKTARKGTTAVERDLDSAAVHDHPDQAAVILLARNYRNMSHILQRCSNASNVLVTLHARLSHIDVLKPLCEMVENDARPFITQHRPLPDLPHPALVRTFSGHGSTVYSAMFSPDGARVVSGSDDKTIRVWDVATGLLLQTLTGHSNRIVSTVFSSDGMCIVSASYDKTSRLWDSVSGVLLMTLIGHEDKVNNAAFSSDGAFVVTGSDDKTVRVWDAATGHLVRTLIGHENRVTSTAFSPDGTRIVSASMDETVRMWDVASGAEINTLSGHEDEVTSVAFSPDGTQIVSAALDKTVRVWDTASGVVKLILTGHDYGVNSVAFSLDGTRIVSTSGSVVDSHDNTIRVWDAKTGSPIFTLTGHTRGVISAVFNPNGTRIVSAAGDKTVRLWDVEAVVDLRLTLTGHTGDINSTGYAFDGLRIVSAAGDKTVRVWDTISGAVTLVLTGHTRWVSSAAFGPDGTQIVSAAGDKTVRVWDVAKGTEVLVLTGHEGAVTSVAFSPDGTQIVSASDDNTLRIWDVVPTPSSLPEVAHKESKDKTKGEAEHSLDPVMVVSKMDEESMMASGYSSALEQKADVPDDNKLQQDYSLSTDQFPEYWKEEENNYYEQHEEETHDNSRLILTGHTDTVNSAAYGSNSGIVSASQDETVRLWSAKTGMEVLTLIGHTKAVSSAVFSSDAMRIVSASSDGTVQVWDAKTGAAVLTLSGPSDELTNATLSPDGKRIVSTSKDGTLQIWDAVMGEVLATFYADVPLDCCAWSPDGRHLVAGGQSGYLYWLRWVE